jgi:hypothetical protein
MAENNKSISDKENTVFISYRRSASRFAARAIFQYLRQKSYDVFMDVESIDSGDFGKIILNQIAARAHFLIILSKGTVERFSEPNDWLREEFETALELKRNIVPIILSDFHFEEAKPYLTGKLEYLNKLNGLQVPDDYFEEAMTRLCVRYLKQPVYGYLSPTPTDEKKEVERKIQKAEDYFEIAPSTEDHIQYELSESEYNLLVSLFVDSRQPLSSIIGYIDLLLGESVGILGNKQMALVEKMKILADEYATLNDQVLEFIEAKRFNELEPYIRQLNTIIQKIKETVDVLLAEKVGILGALQNKFIKRINSNVERIQVILEEYGKTITFVPNK